MFLLVAGCVQAILLRVQIHVKRDSSDMFCQTKETYMVVM